MPREVFVAGQILTAAEMNVVSDATVMTFAGTAARGSAIPSPTEGMVSYLEDSNILSLHDGSAWKNSVGVTGGILQVVQTVKTDTFSTSSATFVDVDGLSVSITPRSTTSKVLVIATYHTGTTTSAVNAAYTRVLRNSTVIGGDNASVSGVDSTRVTTTPAPVILDSPNTTSATTYLIQLRRVDSTTAVLGRSGSTATAAFSSITAMEVAG